jgi:hypothetical protein
MRALGFAAAALMGCAGASPALPPALTSAPSPPPASAPPQPSAAPPAKEAPLCPTSLGAGEIVTTP